MTLTRTASLSLLILALVAASITSATAAQARTTTQRATAAIFKDCAHDGRLNHHYRAKALAAAVRTIPADIDQYTNCHAAISAQRALYVGTRGGRTTTALLHDCHTHGTLRHRYSATQLRRALRHAGGCDDVIVSQLRGRTERVR
ncbi:hypothetical protein DSM104299_03684 [Baekduia alba]|nr:hypothetical protein DSM104299_03684 [Baekduia alba]